MSGDWINSYLLKGLDQGLVADKVLSCTTLPKYDICIFQIQFTLGCRQVIRSYRISKVALAEHADAELAGKANFGNFANSNNIGESKLHTGVQREVRRMGVGILVT